MAIYVAVVVLSAAIAIDVWLLYLNAFDFPYYDEWELFPSGGLRNIFRVFNENMQVFYELASEFMYFFFDESNTCWRDVKDAFPEDGLDVQIKKHQEKFGNNKFENKEN